MVRHGWAVAYRRFSQRYVEVEREAKRSEAVFPMECEDLAPHLDSTGGIEVT